MKILKNGKRLDLTSPPSPFFSLSFSSFHVLLYLGLFSKRVAEI